MYGPELEIGMPVFMDDIMVVGEAENIRTGIRNIVQQWKKKKKFTYRMEKTKYIVIRTGHKKE